MIPARASLEDAVAQARELDTRWDSVRATAVLGRVVAAREARARRGRLLRRGVAAAGGGALLVLALLRVTSASLPPDAAQRVTVGGSASSSEVVEDPRATAIVAAREGDGGFSRD